MGGMSGAGMGGGSPGSGDELFGGKFIDTYYNYRNQTQGYKASEDYWDAFKAGNVANGYVYDASKDTVSQSAFESGDYANVNWRYLRDQGWSLEQIQEYNPGIIELTQDNALPDWVVTASEMNPRAQGQSGRTANQSGSGQTSFTSRTSYGGETSGSDNSEGNYDRTRQERQTLTFDNLGISNIGNREGVTYDENGNASIDTDYFSSSRGWSSISPWTSTSGNSSADSAYAYYGSRNKTSSRGKSQSKGEGESVNQVWGWLQQ